MVFGVLETGNGAGTVSTWVWLFIVLMFGWFLWRAINRWKWFDPDNRDNAPPECPLSYEQPEPEHKGLAFDEDELE